MNFIPRFHITRLNPVAISLLLILILKSVTASGQQRPNILWITIEDTSPQFIGCYGNINARTHVIDKLAEEAFEMPPFYNDTPEMRKHFARVYNSIKLVDKQIGELLESLNKDHLSDSTIIFFYYDHGEGIPRAKTNGINMGYRVPFII